MSSFLLRKANRIIRDNEIFFGVCDSSWIQPACMREARKIGRTVMESKGGKIAQKYNDRLRRCGSSTMLL